HSGQRFPKVTTPGEGPPMPPTDTPPAPDPRRPDTSAFLEQQAAILLDAPDNDTMVRRLLAAALRRVSAVGQQLAAPAPPRAARPTALAPARHPDAAAGAAHGADPAAD